MLTVTNRNSFDLNDRFDGTDFCFPAGKTTAITEDAARHIFGLGEADKKDALVRLGWLATTGDMSSATDKLNNFSFDVVSDISPGDVIEASSEEPMSLVEEQGTAPLQEDATPETPVEGVADASDGSVRRFSKLLSGGA